MLQLKQELANKALSNSALDQPTPSRNDYSLDQSLSKCYLPRDHSEYTYVPKINHNYGKNSNSLFSLKESTLK